MTSAGRMVTSKVAVLPDRVASGCGRRERTARSVSATVITSLTDAALVAVSTVRILLGSNGSETRKRRGKADLWVGLF